MVKMGYVNHSTLQYWCWSMCLQLTVSVYKTECSMWGLYVIKIAMSSDRLSPYSVVWSDPFSSSDKYWSLFY